MAKKARRRMKRQNGQWVYSAAQVTIDPSPWDEGTRPAAREAFAVVEERGEVDSRTGKTINPNGVRGLRYMDMMEVYAKRGWISDRGYLAGCKLRLAWLATEKGQCSPWMRERVDSSPKPDAAIGIQIDRLSKLIRLGSVIPLHDRRIIECVTYHGTGIGSLREYRGSQHDKGKVHLFQAFDRLADAIEKVA